MKAEKALRGKVAEVMEDFVTVLFFAFRFRLMRKRRKEGEAKRASDAPARFASASVRLIGYKT
jgi:hypothetical protein